MRKLVVGSVFLVITLFTITAQDIAVMKSDAIMEEGLQNYEKAAKLYEDAALGYEKDGVIDTTCWYRAGVCNLKLKNDQKALDIFTKLELKNVKTGELMYSMGDAYYGLKKFVKAESYFLKAIELDDAMAFDANKKLVLVSYNSRKFDKAVDYSSNVLAIDSTDVYTLYLRMLALEMNKNIDEAVIAGEKLLSLKPNHKNGTKKLGLLYAKQVDIKYDNEKKRYDAIKTPSRVDFSNTNKKLKAISKGYSKAIPLLEKALANKPNDEMVMKVLDNAKSRMNAQ